LTSLTNAQRRAMYIFLLTLALAATRFATQTWAAGAFAIGKCGAYGQAFDYAGEAECYEFGGKDCVIRAGACDAKG
jgi:hypothetical protein